MSKVIKEESVDWEQEAGIVASLQDGVADLKRTVIESVDCWNIK